MKCLDLFNNITLAKKNKNGIDSTYILMYSVIHG